MNSLNITPQISLSRTHKRYGGKDIFLLLIQ